MLEGAGCYSIWLTGLPSSGKTTLAGFLHNHLSNNGFKAVHLDGDKVRKGLCSDLGFSAEDRKENLRRVAELNKLFLDAGFLCINSFICPLEEYRIMVRQIVGSGNYLEVFVDTPLAICEQRDSKELYQKARSGDIKDFTGISAPFELPAKPHLVIQNGEIPINEAGKILIQFMDGYLALE
jgi:adenylylsulfate kinase